MPKQKQKVEQSPTETHIPVMVQEVLSYLSPQKGEKYLDLTAGYGGHAATVIGSVDKLAEVTLVDRDAQAVRALTDRFSGEQVQIMHSDFASASQKLGEAGKSYDMILADLGASSLHLDEPGRGFSFLRSGPLDMRMDQRQAVTADYFVNQANQEELERILVVFGEEPRAKTIADRIIKARPVSSTEELAKIIENAVGRRFGRKKIHPATRSFQALRIAVNQELHQLELSLPIWHKLLAPGGRLVVISFQSLEDRIVKRYLAENAGDRYDTDLRLLTRKPVTASHDEIVLNPRARSAKLRAAAKIKTKRKDKKEKLNAN
jgi:16S rRNA (cytosine1402-N4)-methyltransferase